ncbi:MAG: glycosyltransferase, partial [Candidatus Hodarchaeota archaeon]
MKKILIIAPMFPPPFTGGACTHLLNLVNELKKLPFKITIFTHDLKSRNKFKIIKKFLHPKILLYRFPTISLPRIQYKFISLRLIIEFLKIKPDIIHAHGYPFHVIGDLSIFLAHIFGIPIILTIHAYP